MDEFGSREAIEASLQDKPERGSGRKRHGILAKGNGHLTSSKSKEKKGYQENQSTKRGEENIM